MKYIFKKARKMQANNETPMVVDVDETDTGFIATPDIHPRQVAPQSSAYNLLASMIASSDTIPPLPSANPGLAILSPSPTLQNVLQTPSPSASNFAFGNFAIPPEQFPAEDISAPIEQPQPQPVNPPIKIKLRKVAMSNYIIEAPKDNKQPSPAIDSTPPTTQFAVPFDTGGFTTESNVMLSTVPFPQTSNVEHLMSPAPDDQPIDLLPPGSVSFSDVDNTAFLPNVASTSVSGTSRVTDVEGIFQTLPGGATSSPVGFDVEDTYAFDAGPGKQSFCTTNLLY